MEKKSSLFLIYVLSLLYSHVLLYEIAMTAAFQSWVSQDLSKGSYQRTTSRMLLCLFRKCSIQKTPAPLFSLGGHFSKYPQTQLNPN